MLSGDGNFHLYSYSKVNGPSVNPSVYGDYGFWVPYKLAKNYTGWADDQKGAEGVNFFFLPYDAQSNRYAGVRLL